MTNGCRAGSRAGDGWARYLAGFHADRAGITEQVLAPAVARGVPGPYAWLAEPLRATRGPVLDVACGSAPSRDLLSGPRWFGVDAAAGELAVAAAAGRGPLVRARADRLPVADGAVGAVIAGMCLQVVTPLDDVLDEVRRVLRPGGLLVALVPSTRPDLGLLRHPAGWCGWWKILRALGVGEPSWPNPQALDGLAGVLRTAGFAVESDARRVYWRRVADAADAELLVDSLYLPGIASPRIAGAKRALTAWAGPGRQLPFPLRRIVARVTGSG